MHAINKSLSLSEAVVDGIMAAMMKSRGCSFDVTLCDCVTQTVHVAALHARCDACTPHTVGACTPHRMRHALLDAHTHLHLHPNPQEAVRQALAAGVEKILVCGTQPPDWKAVKDLHRAYPQNIIPSWGVHPYYAQSSGAPSTWLPELERYIEECKQDGYSTVGVGECGLDKSPKGLEKSDWDSQVTALEAQLAFAAHSKLPVTLHCVRAQRELLASLHTLGADLPSGILLHSWAGKPSDASKLQALGKPCVFSISGSVVTSAGGGVFGASKDCLESVRKLHADVVAFETDSPDQPFQISRELYNAWGEEEKEVVEELSPTGGGGGGSGGEVVVKHHLPPNSPARVSAVVKACALLRGNYSQEGVQALSESSYKNVMRLFITPSI